LGISKANMRIFAQKTEDVVAFYGANVPFMALYRLLSFFTVNYHPMLIQKSERDVRSTRAFVKKT
jgi:hypothetical protein